MSSNFPSDSHVSPFTEVDSTILACRVHEILNTSVDRSTAHHDPNYLDVMKVRYRTYYMECSRSQAFCELPSMFEREFGSESHGYNMLVDRFGNKFEVIIEKRGYNLCLTHGWSEITNCYLNDEVTTGWVSLTCIRPKLLVLSVKDRSYKDLIGKPVL